MSRRRIILGAPTQTGLVEELRLRIGEVGGDFGTGVATQAATSFGTGGVRLLAARDDHKHPYLIAPKSMIQPVSPTTSTAGVTEYFPRADHVHFVDPGAAIYGAGASNVSLSTSTGGVEAAASRGDHVHYLIPATNISNVSLANWTSGIDTAVARGDHVHYLVPAVTASNVSFAGSTAGVASNVSRGDHVHYFPPGVRTSQAYTQNVVYTNSGSGPLFLNITAWPNAATIIQLYATSPQVLLGEVECTFFKEIFQICGPIKPGESYYMTADTGVNVVVWIEYGF